MYLAPLRYNLNLYKHPIKLKHKGQVKEDSESKNHIKFQL